LLEPRISGSKAISLIQINGSTEHESVRRKRTILNSKESHRLAVCQMAFS